MEKKSIFGCLSLYIIWFYPISGSARGEGHNEVNSINPKETQFFEFEIDF
jgi:hypothetical protein